MPRRDWPSAGDYLWDIFIDMSRDRQDGPAGPQPFGPLLIQAWMELTGTMLSPAEVKVIRDMDQAWLHAHAKEVAVGSKAAEES